MDESILASLFPRRPRPEGRALPSSEAARRLTVAFTAFAGEPAQLAPGDLVRFRPELRESPAAYAVMPDRMLVVVELRDGGEPNAVGLRTDAVVGYRDGDGDFMLTACDRRLLERVPAADLATPSPSVEDDAPLGVLAAFLADPSNLGSIAYDALVPLFEGGVPEMRGFVAGFEGWDDNLIRTPYGRDATPAFSRGRTAEERSRLWRVFAVDGRVTSVERV